MTQRAVENTENSLEKIKRQLASASGRNLLQGPLLKRSETVINSSSRYFLFSYFDDQYCVHLVSFITTTPLLFNLQFLIFIAYRELWSSNNSNVFWVLWSFEQPILFSPWLLASSCKNRFYFFIWCVDSWENGTSVGWSWTQQRGEWNTSRCIYKYTYTEYIVSLCVEKTVNTFGYY